MPADAYGPGEAAQPPAPPFRVFLLDDHEIVRRGLVDLLSGEPDLVVVGEAATVAEARAGIHATVPDVALLDARLPDGTGLELCRDIRSALPSVQCLILTSYNESDALVAAVLAGASGYLLKEIGTNRLTDALRTVASGGSLLDPDTVAAVAALLRTGPQSDAPLGELTHREEEIVALMTDGLTNRDIATRTGLSERSVRAYVAGVIAKLSTRSPG